MLTLSPLRWAGPLALVGGIAGCAPPPPPVPVCGRAEVLQQVQDALRVQGRPVVLDVPPVGEVSVPAPAPVAATVPGMPAVVRCAVRAHTVGFDTNRFGMAPVHEPFTIRYTIEQRRNGLFVRIE